MDIKASKNIWCGTTPTKDAIERASAIKLLLMDVDGVLTDGKVYYLPMPEGRVWENKGFDCHDGLAFHFLKDAGIETGFISGRQSQAVVERANNMHVKYINIGDLQKESAYQNILAQAGLTDKQVAYIGDDFTDVCLLKRAGLACAVANARVEILPYTHFVTQAVGGQGAMREVVELILKAQKKWTEVLGKYGL